MEKENIEAEAKKRYLEIDKKVGEINWQDYLLGFVHGSHYELKKATLKAEAQLKILQEERAKWLKK